VEAVPEESGSERRTAVEQLVGRDLDRASGLGRPLSSRARQTARSVEAYLKAGVRPRWMERLIEIERGMARERGRLAEEHRALGLECGEDREAFARRWRERAAAWRFDDLNELIEQHNQWYPMERQLPMDVRTRDYVPVNGRSYRRPLLGPEWVLEHFPT
jgi:hypothetical protein